MMPSADPQDEDPREDLAAMNDVLSQWAARSATESESLIERLETMGYEIRGRSEEEIVEILRRPPTRPGR